MGWIVPIVIVAAALWPQELNVPTTNNDDIESGSGGDPHFMRL